MHNKLNAQDAQGLKHERSSDDPDALSACLVGMCPVRKSNGTITFTQVFVQSIDAVKHLEEKLEKTKQTLTAELQNSQLSVSQLTEANRTLVQQSGASKQAYDELQLKLVESQGTVTDNVRGLLFGEIPVTSNSYTRRRPRFGERKQARRNGNRSITSWW